MLPDTRTTYCPHVAHLCGYTVCGLKNILDCAEEMKSKSDALPDELKPYGEAIVNISMEMLIEHYIACLQAISELDIREITRKAQPPEQQTEQES
jgi:hypothetical protein